MACAPKPATGKTPAKAGSAAAKMAAVRAGKSPAKAGSAAAKKVNPFAKKPADKKKN